MSTLNPAQMLSLALGQSVLYIARAYGKQYKPGDWQNGMDFYSLVMSPYFSINNAEMLKEEGFIEVAIMGKRGEILDQFKL